MNFLKKIIILIISPFIISWYGGDYAHLASRSNPELRAYWDIEPSIKVCSSLKISESRVRLALKYWENLGYKFGRVVINDSSISCAGHPMFGELIITIPSQNFDYMHMAETRRTVERDTREVIYAEISILQSNVKKERVLEHEIGHALGWDHTFSRYHIMNDKWTSGGHNASGVRHSDYIRFSDKLKKELGL